MRLVSSYRPKPMRTCTYFDKSKLLGTSNARDHKTGVEGSRGLADLRPGSCDVENGFFLESYWKLWLGNAFSSARVR